MTTNTQIWTGSKGSTPINTMVTEHIENAVNKTRREVEAGTVSAERRALLPVLEAELAARKVEA